MCRIFFNTVITGSEPVGLEGRYRPDTSVDPLDWVEFTIDMNDQKTPDILTSDNYVLQVRAVYLNSEYSDWTDSATFTVGDCGVVGNLYAPIIYPKTCNKIGVPDFTVILFSNNPASGTVCFRANVGDYLYKDSNLTIPANSGPYVLYSSFNGCTSGQAWAIQVNAAGMVINRYSCGIGGTGGGSGLGTN